MAARYLYAQTLRKRENIDVNQCTGAHNHIQINIGQCKQTQVKIDPHGHKLETSIEQKLIQ